MNRIDKKPRELETAAVARIAAYGGDWTVLLDHTSAIVYEIGSRDLVFGGEGRTSSIGRRIAAFVRPEDMGTAMDRMEESLASTGTEIEFEIHAGTPETGYRRVRVLALNQLDDPMINGVILQINSVDDA